MEQNGVKIHQHSLTLEGRTRARITGVTAVSCFNDREVVLETSEGEVALLGSGLNIEQLNLEEGALGVTGSIEGIEYNGPAVKKVKKGLPGRRK